MSQEVPKAVREVLAHQTAGEPHVSSDLLNAYLELSLTPAERQQVQSHLAACTECREVMFLVNGLADQPAVVPASSSAWTWRRWRWAVPAVALLAIVSAVLVQHERSALQSKPVMMATTSAPTPPLDRVPQQLTASASTPESSADIARNASRLESQNDLVQPGKPAKKSPAPSSMTSADALRRQPFTPLGEPAMRAAPPAAKPSEADIQGSSNANDLENSLLKAAPAIVAGAPPRNSFRQDESTPATATTIASPMKMQWRSSWRVAQEGSLERSIGSDMWWPVKVDDTTKFRVVSVVGNDVWAGGEGGALFHSPDGGVSWSRVPLRYGDKVEDGTIITIQFATAERGRAATDAGSHWSTSDGGRNWVKQ